MKRFALALMMIGIATLIAVPTASAEMFAFGLLDGTFEMVASGSCLHSPSGFTLSSDGVYTSNGGAVWAASTFAEATWNFERDGSGTVSGWNYVIDFPPGRVTNATTTPPTQTPGVRKNPIAFKFHYSLAGNGDIAVTFDAPFGPPVLPAMHGKVSISRMAMTLWSAYEPQQGGVVICNTGRTLIRVIE